MVLRIAATAMAVAAMEIGAVDVESGGLDWRMVIWGFGSGGVCGGLGAVVAVDVAAAEKNANGVIAVAMVVDFRGFELLVYLVEEDFLLIHYFSFFFFLSFLNRFLICGIHIFC